MLCLLIFLQKRGFSLKLGKINLTKALPKCKKETQHGNYNLCRNGCPQSALNHVKSNRKKSGESSKNLTQNRSLMRAEKWDWI